MRWGLILLACFIIGCKDQASTQVESSTTLALDSSIVESSKPIVLMFYSTSCQPCKVLEQNLAHAKLQHLISSFALYPIDIYAKDPITLPFATPTSAKSLRQDLHIYATPTLMLFDKHHLVAFKHIGILSVDDLALLLTLIPTLPENLQTQESKQQWLSSHLTHARASKGSL